MEQELKKIAHNTRLKPTFQIVLNGYGSRLEARFIPALDFHAGCSYELALVSLETYYSFPNIDNSNNRLKVYLDDKWISLIISVGCYELEDINREIQRQIHEKNGETGFSLKANLNTLKCDMILPTGMQIDFTGESSIRTVLGFDSKIYKKKRNESENTVNIMRVNSILVHCNLINSSYLNGTPQPIVYAFFPNALPGEKIIVQPNSLTYLPLTGDFIPQVTAWLTDQELRPIDLRGEKLTIKFHIKAC